MIAYDLDGVLVPDMDYLPNYPVQEDFYELMTNVKALFQPSSSYSIITARPAEYKYLTEYWAQKQLRLQPVEIYQTIGTESPAEYKATILNMLPQVKLYVESDQQIVEQMKSLVKYARVLHFGTSVDRLIKSRVASVRH